MGQPAIAVLGAGAMGANHARVIAEHPGADLGLVVDTDEGRARAVAEANGAKWSLDAADALDYDGVVVAVPTEHHLAVARPLIEAGCPVLVEKPVALTLAEAQALVDLATERGVPLLCGFVERFNPVVRTALELLDEQPVHFVALRHSPANTRSTVSVVQDLLIHDIDLALRFGAHDHVSEVHATRRCPSNATVDEIADCSLAFAGGMMATLSASRAGQRKLRTVFVTAPDQVFELDLLRQDLTIYRHVYDDITFSGAKGYQADTIVDIPFIRHAGEPLALQFGYFLDLVGGRADPEREWATILAPHAVAELVEA